MHSLVGKCPMDILYVHWTFQMSIGSNGPLDNTHYSSPIYQWCCFPVVTKSDLVHWIQLTVKYPMNIRYVHWIHWTCTCPQLFILTGKLYPNFHILSSSNGTKFLKLPITSIHLSVIQACLWQRKGLNLFSLTFTKYAINLSQALIKVFRIWSPTYSAIR
jgi:hypothetical protein